jgi:hypothetical protein
MVFRCSFFGLSAPHHYCETQLRVLLHEIDRIIVWGKTAAIDIYVMQDCLCKQASRLPNIEAPDDENNIQETQPNVRNQ